MNIREVHVTRSDKKSAQLFFDAMLEFYDIRNADGLDMFARDGALTVSNYAYKVENLDVWELMEAHRPALANFRPRDLIIGCSYKALAVCERKYDLVVVDSPQGLHHDHLHTARVEHFDVMRQIGTILKKDALIVLYVNKRPYNKDEVGDHGYDQYQEYDFKRWMIARKEFYDYDPQNLTEEAAMRAYRNVLGKQAIRVKSQLIVPCYSDVPGMEPYAFRIALECERL